MIEFLSFLFSIKFQKACWHTHYTRSVVIEVVQVFGPLPGLRQLCAPLAARCGLVEQVYHYDYVRDAKNILPYISTHSTVHAGHYSLLRKSWGNIFNNYIFEISGFH